MSGPKSMSDTLGEVFGTKVASASQEDLEKTANLNFFRGLCEEQSINVDELNDAQIQDLWKVAMDMRKEAGEMPPQFAKKDGDEDKDEKKPEAKDDKEKEAAALAQAKEAAAVREFSEKRAAAEKIAEADSMGRIMAHSFVDELTKMAAEGNGFPFAKKDGDDKKDEKKDGDKDDKKKEASSADKVAALVDAQKAKIASTPSSSSMPNFDEQACYLAIDMLKQAGCEPELAFNRINAVHTLGLQESTKIASVTDVNAALQIRALEVCEAAGFPVDWAQA